MDEQSEDQDAWVRLRKKILSTFIPGDESDRWMRTLIQIGAFVAGADSSRPLTVAGCLPRVEFAGLLAAVGACLYAVQSPLRTDWRQGLEKLVRRRIAYSLCGNPYVFWEGVLCEFDLKDPAHLKIQGTQDGPPDVWPMADLCSVKLDPERDGQPLENTYQAKTAFRDTRSNRLRNLMSEEAVGKLCSWWHQLTLIGTKNRIRDELDEVVPRKSDVLTWCTFADLVRPDMCVTNSVVMRLLSPKDLTSESACGIVLIEGSRRLAEHLKATQRHHRIILLGRNEPHYSESAETVNGHFHQRVSDVPVPDFDCPAHLKLKVFHH